MKSVHPITPNLAGRRASPAPGHGKKATDRLHELTGFGSNPGALRAWTHVPHGLGDAPPLVVVLHGCTQNAAAYNDGAGWSQLADELGFVVLFPEQQRSNNLNLCFNWFSPIDSRRDSGEALSIRQMIAAMVKAHAIDERRVFVTGLSAGGVMTSIMLATYPEVFAGGAIVAGLPFGAASSVGDAFSRMAGHGYPADAELAALVQAASAHDGPWPRISVWQGSADTTVNPSNADRIIAQWGALHGVDKASSVAEQHGDHSRRIWRNAALQPVLEENIITGMGHGTPLKTDGPDGCGKAGPYMLDVGISSTRAIAQFWGLNDIGLGQGLAKIAARIASVSHAEMAAIPKKAKGFLRHTPARRRHNGMVSVIENALRAVGLMK